ncbi:hypothetical protein ACQPZJ_44790 [Actinoplanes sp. CA-054009]
MTRLMIATYNYQAGGAHGATFDMRPLQRAFASLDTAPAVILFCEAKNYRRDQYRGLRLAEKALTDVLDAPYIGLLGTSQNGPLPPAIFYNTTLLTNLDWPSDDPHDPNVFADKRNVGRFQVNASTTQFGAWVAHFNPRSGPTRLDEAKLLDRYGLDPLPFIGGGDLNSSASGAHFPQRDWHNANHHIRTHKAVWIDDGTPHGHWQADTGALDQLIGRWDPASRRRLAGSGYHAIAELAWLANPTTAITPSVIDKPGQGGPELIDYLLVNDAMRPHLIDASYQVHRPDGPPSSDHHLITAEIDI